MICLFYLCRNYRTYNYVFEIINDLLINLSDDNNSTSTNAFFKGIIDDLRIYNRTVSESEIEQMYQQNSAYNKIIGKIINSKCWRCYCKCYTM